MKAKRIVLYSIALILVTALAVGAAIGAVVMYVDRPGPLEDQVNLVFAKGSSVKTIAHQMADAQVIDQPYIFLLVLKATKTGKQFKAGEYNFLPGITPWQVIGKLVKGETIIRKVTIPEGLTTWQILERIKETPELSGDMPLNVAEGSLLPETYHFSYGDTRTEVVEQMQKRMQDTLTRLWEKRAHDLPFTTTEEALTLASIVEKETGIPEERGRVAAVFINRLRKHMRLQTDPTVIYAVTEGKGIMDRPLLLKDLAIDSPYNTYVIDGLPPHPIANPGEASIAAVLNPPVTDEYFFVATGTGGHNFARTLEEHNDNVRSLRKVTKEQEAAAQEEQKKEEPTKEKAQ